MLSCIAKQRRLEAMSLENHLQELSARHKKIDDALQEESKRPSSDSLKMSRMKREKLKLKEEIQSLRGDLNS
ncbi:YdcH family protein [Ponticaulis sp.]|uniref:YdcH family protein n=1 Tax=Ponticaulis sp. TaxID=2020902 RepID=UPI00345BD386|tara:strand:+ start:718 stop:933 length:216 start_codon:yes stop_codon:yes gene_type:complete